jgi:hypothetical protein
VLKFGELLPKGSDTAQKIVDASVAEVGKHFKLLVDTERSAVRRALNEERSRYCIFVTCFKPLLDEENALVSEFQQLEEVSNRLVQHTADPYKLPPASEQVIIDLAKNCGDGCDFSYTTPPSSPGGSSLGSRKSSMCSISSAGSNTSLAQQQHSPSHSASVAAAGASAHPMGPQIGHSATLRHRSMSQAAANNLGPTMMRLSSISSQDSGFTSQDTLFMRPNSPSNRSKVVGNLSIILFEFHHH